MKRWLQLAREFDKMVTPAVKDKAEKVRNAIFAHNTKKATMSKKQPIVDITEGRTTIKHEGLSIIITDDRVTIDTDRSLSLKGRTLKRLNGVKGSSINDVLHKLEE